MTVWELIEILKEFDEDLPVEARNAAGDLDWIDREDIQKGTDSHGKPVIQIK